ncbi:MAG: hypothetical protein MSG64_10005 [Pyrinomonadaceae bacterium MAG19_C2-C3]|nr:hypothetical protein [Pyrinomonadaceae bacterium MAG19_C2-C3]
MIPSNTLTGSLISATLLICASSFTSSLYAMPSPRQSAALDAQAGSGAPTPSTRSRNVKPQQILRLLNLSFEQRAQIRRIRQETEAARRALVSRLRAAQRELDAAIYSDDVSEQIIVERANAVALAQGELTRRRAVTELHIRRVLSAQQLATLRDLRANARAQISVDRDGANQINSVRGRLRGRRRQTPNSQSIP